MKLLGDTFALYTRPEKQKVYTTQEAAELLNTNCDEIRRIVNRYNIEYDFISTKKARTKILTYDAFRLVEEIFKRKEEKREYYKELRRQKALKEVQEENQGAQDHPLVTDKRCLSLSYWPDIVPDCFKEIDA